MKMYNKIKDEEQKTLFKEYVIFCNYATNEMFDNYFKIDEIEQFDFYCMIEFCFKYDLFNMLYRFLKSNPQRLIMPYEERIEELQLRADFKERFNRFMFSK